MGCVTKNGFDVFTVELISFLTSLKQNFRTLINIKFSLAQIFCEVAFIFSYLATLQN